MERPVYGQVQSALFEGKVPPTASWRTKLALNERREAGCDHNCVKVENICTKEL